MRHRVTPWGCVQSWGVDTHVCDDGHPEVGHVGDDLAVLSWDLGVLDQLVQVLLGDACVRNG